LSGIKLGSDSSYESGLGTGKGVKDWVEKIAKKVNK
jgi:hypothetical protein